MELLQHGTEGAAKLDNAKRIDGSTIGLSLRQGGLCLLILFLLGMVRVSAAPLELSNQREVTYAFQGERLTDVLARFFADQGIRLVMSQALRQDRRTLNGRMRGTPEEILRNIEDSNALLTYYDEQTAYVYLANEAEYKLLAISPKYSNRVQIALAQMGMMDAKNQTKLYGDSSMLEIRGAPRYVTHTVNLVNTITQNQNGLENFVIQYFPLKYAWASDRTFQAGQRSVTVPGVATLLRQVISGVSDPESQFDISVDEVNKASIDIRPDKPLSADSVTSLNKDNEAGNRNSGGRTRSVVADPYRNAVIVRDTPDNMTMYEHIIAQLDVPTQIVEIEATIIDVNTDRMRALGTDWRYEDNENDFDASSASDSDIKSDFINVLQSNSLAMLQQVPGLQLGAIVGDEQRFVARLHALEREGVVNVSSRPKVATLNDLEAVIEASQSIYVPVESTNDANLFEIFSGTVFRVTPHVIEDNGRNRIRLTISVQDGTAEVGNNNLPISTRNSINTQAIIDEGHSLLLGGLDREETVTSEARVPLLGSIPILGYLFKNERKTTRKSERLFLISPRLVTAGEAYGEGADTMPDSTPEAPDTPPESSQPQQ